MVYLLSGYRALQLSWKNRSKHHLDCIPPKYKYWRLSLGLLHRSLRSTSTVVAWWRWRGRFLLPWSYPPSCTHETSCLLVRTPHGLDAAALSGMGWGCNRRWRQLFLCCNTWSVSILCLHHTKTCNYLVSICFSSVFNVGITEHMLWFIFSNTSSKI